MLDTLYDTTMHLDGSFKAFEDTLLCEKEENAIVSMIGKNVVHLCK